MSSLIPPLPTSGRPLPHKVVIRLLPPTISEQDLQIADETKQEMDWARFVPGRRPERPSPEDPIVNGRFYAQFKSFSAASDFIQKFHGRLFSVAKGEVYRAVAAFAPYQRVVKPGKQLKNVLAGTYEASEHYVSFLENGPKIETPDTPALVSERRKDYVSPLVSAIAEAVAKAEVPVVKSSGGSKAQVLAAQWKAAAVPSQKSAPQVLPKKGKAGKLPPPPPPPPSVGPKQAPLSVPKQTPGGPKAKMSVLKRTVSPEVVAPPPPPPARSAKKKLAPPAPPKVDSL